MIERAEVPSTDRFIEATDIDTGNHAHELQTVAITVDLPTEFQALLGDLSSAGGKDAEGNNTKVWKIAGIQSIDLSLSEPGKTMVFTIDPGYNLDEIHTQLRDWLSDLRIRRRETERRLAHSAVSQLPKD